MLELTLPPDWDTIKGLWDRCLAFFKDNGLSGDTAYALSMTTQELLENAVKYGAYSKERPTLSVSMGVGTRAVTIEVRSPARGLEQELSVLDDTIQWIRGYQNPFEAYIEKLKQISAQPFRGPESGLGLVRIAYEGQCLLDFYVDETDTLALSAVYQIPPKSHAHL